MNIHPAVISGVSAFIVLLISLGIGNLQYRVRKIENESVSDEMLNARLDVIDERIKSITTSIKSSEDSNKEEHKILFKVLEDIKDCVTKLANGKTEC